MAKAENILIKSAENMKKLGGQFARDIPRFLKKNPAKRRCAVILSLEGELGSGKTTFAQGFAGGLGIKKNPRSPTFVIMQIYGIADKKKMFKNFIHIDAYRIASKDLKMLGWDGFVKNKENIILIEWGNRIKSLLPESTMKILFYHRRRSGERGVKILK